MPLFRKRPSETRPSARSAAAARVKPTGEEGNMDQTCGDRRLLGTMLVEQGAVNDDDVEVALRTQLETGDRLGEILVQRGLVCRPELVRALALQSGVELDEQRGFGTGLPAAIERRHGWRGFRVSPA
jgi:hypothetical protein